MGGPSCLHSRGVFFCCRVLFTVPPVEIHECAPLQRSTVNVYELLLDIKKSFCLSDLVRVILSENVTNICL